MLDGSADVASKEFDHLIVAAFEQCSKLRNRVLPVVSAVDAMSEGFVDILPMLHESEVLDPGCIRSREQEGAAGSENSVNLGERVDRISWEMFENLTEQHEVEGRLLIGEHGRFHVEMIELIDMGAP